jgi:CHAT domain-containing protein
LLLVSLASGLLEAGVAGVVATQWKVPDLSSAMLMIRFYETWRKHGLDPLAALQSAQRWMRDTTNGEKAAYLAPDAVIATGLPTEATRPLWRHITCLPPEEHSFAHPCHWSGFVYLGG